jgi:predicted phage terminase large subunit-like protein
MTTSPPASPSWNREFLALLEERGRRLARQSLGTFAHYLAPPEYQFNWHHDLLYDYLDDFCEGRRRRVIVQMPPGHGKSEGVSRNLPAYLLGKNPDLRVMACSHTSDLAAEMNRDVQRIISGPRYRSVFPGTALSRTSGPDGRRNADLFDVAGRRGYYKCAGVGGAITGRRFDIGIIDDPVKDRAAANSPATREAVWRWYTSAFHTRQAKGAGILLTLTRWHEDDLAGRLLAKAAAGESEPWDVLSLPAVATGKNQHPEDPRRPGEALWPWFRPAEELAKIEQTEPRDFAALYQQDPISEGGTEWPPEYFAWDGFWFDDWPEDVIFKVMALDPSMADSDHPGDYQALVVLYLDGKARVYVDAFLVRLDATRLVEFAVGVWQEHEAAAFAIESNVFQKLLLKDFARVSRERTLRIPLYAIPHKKVEKKLRLRTLGPYLARRELRFRRGSAGARILVEQLKQFPVGQFDDGPDALQMGIKMMKFMLGQRRERPEEGALPMLFAG